MSRAVPGWPFIEIGTDEAEISRDFFSRVMGWPVAGEGEARYFDAPGGAVGLHGDDTPMMVVYFPVGDLEAGLSEVRSGGGEVVGDIDEEPGFGRFATCVDPRGVRFGLHQRT